MKYSLYIAIIVCVLSGCAGSFQGIRFRAQAPPIDEAFRKISIAISADDYEIAGVDPAKFSIESSWRALKDNEKSGVGTGSKGGATEAKITIRLERRGQMYDVFATPTLRVARGATETVADVQHPLWQKWQRVLNSLLRKEAREED